jgi:hypothetical protein
MAPADPDLADLRAYRRRLEQTIREMQAAQDPGPGTARLAPPAEDTQALIADCGVRLARYQAALNAGADPPGRRRVDPPG